MFITLSNIIWNNEKCEEKLRTGPTDFIGTQDFHKKRKGKGESTEKEGKSTLEANFTELTYDLTKTARLKI